MLAIYSMRLNSDYRVLFDCVEPQLELSVAGLCEQDWTANTLRQRTFVAHEQTSSIIYLWSEHGYSSIKTVIEPERDALSGSVYAIAERFRLEFGPKAVISKLMLARMNPGASIPLHRDQGLLEQVHRCHYVVATNSSCWFTINGTAYNFKAGLGIEIDNQAPHSVVNEGSTSRVHLICDVLDPARLF